MSPNLKYIQKLADGSESFEKKMKGILKNEFPVEKETFLEAYKTEQFLTAAETVHKLKHKLGMLGMKKAYNFAIDFESDLKNKKTTGYSKFIAILEIVETFINKL